MMPACEERTRLFRVGLECVISDWDYFGFQILNRHFGENYRLYD